MKELVLKLLSVLPSLMFFTTSFSNILLPEELQLTRGHLEQPSISVFTSSHVGGAVCACMKVKKIHIQYLNF